MKHTDYYTILSGAASVAIILTFLGVRKKAKDGKYHDHMNTKVKVRKVKIPNPPFRTGKIRWWQRWL